MVHGYEAAFAPEAQGETLDSEESMPKIVRQAMRAAAGRSWKHLADERIEGIAPTIPLGKRFWQLTQDERQAVQALFIKQEVGRLATVLRSRDDAAAPRSTTDMPRDNAQRVVAGARNLSPLEAG